MKSYEIINEDKTTDKILVVFDVDDTLWDPDTEKPKTRIIDLYNKLNSDSDTDVILLTARASNEPDSDILPSQLKRLGVTGKINFAGDMSGYSRADKKVQWLLRHGNLDNYTKLVAYDDLDENLSEIKKLKNKFSNLKIKTILVK